jgi:hypothetical protein
MATYVGDTPLIKYDCKETVTALSTMPKLNYRKPDGTTGSWVATLSTQYAQYQTVSGDIDVAGIWYVQPELSDGTKKFYGERRTFIVENPLYIN